MLTFKAEDGYSYLVTVNRENKTNKVYRIDSEELKINLGTNENVEITRLDVSPEISKKLSDILFVGPPYPPMSNVNPLYAGGRGCPQI